MSDPNASSTPLFRAKVVDLVRAGRGNGATLAQLEHGLTKIGLVWEESGLAALLDEAEAKGEIVRSGKNRFVAIEHTDYWAGTLRLTSRGFGVLRAREAGDQPEIVVAPEKLGTALDGDEVLVHRRSQRKKGQVVAEKFGEVVRVLRRRRPTLVGRFMPDAERPWVEPLARRLKFGVILDPLSGATPRDGEFVEVALDEIPEVGPVRGRLLRRLGAYGESGTDEEVVLAELAIPVEFPPDALSSAEALPARVMPGELEGRADRRDQPVITIDGATARDFDDAVVAFPAPDGAIEVFVHIADVSHYVTPGSAIDLAARERGTSVYLPGRCVPMLPEKLSNHLCSLVGEQDRLAFSVRFLVTANGAVEGYRAERSVIRSRRRCTYDEVFEWIDTKRYPAGLPDGVRSSVELLDEAARRLLERRQSRGSIDFDLPEPEILLDPEGFMTGVRASERNRAHRLIEDLMVTANDCVARMLVFGKAPGLFRVHERPSAGRLAELEAVLNEFGHELKGDLEDLAPRELQRVLSAIEGTPEERFLQTLVLRSLARAAYLPECRGHYALATNFYLHFTSPIRRYPDLVVHRFLGELLLGKVPQGTQRELIDAELADLAQQCSYTERRAEEAEREVVKWKQAEFMRAHIGEEFHGHVVGVTAFGLFVQLGEVYVEGLVHVSDLKDDYYRYDEVGHRLTGQRTKRVYRLGDPLSVRVRGIDDETMGVDLEPVGVPPAGEGKKRTALERPRRGRSGAPRRRKPGKH